MIVSGTAFAQAGLHTLWDLARHGWELDVECYTWPYAWPFNGQCVPWYKAGDTLVQWVYIGLGLIILGVLALVSLFIMKVIPHLRRRV